MTLIRTACKLIPAARLNGVDACPKERDEARQGAKRLSPRDGVVCDDGARGSHAHETERSKRDCHVRHKRVEMDGAPLLRILPSGWSRRSRLGRKLCREVEHCISRAERESVVQAAMVLGVGDHDQVPRHGSERKIAPPERRLEADVRPGEDEVGII